MLNKNLNQVNSIYLFQFQVVSLQNVEKFFFLKRGGGLVILYMGFKLVHILQGNHCSNETDYLRDLAYVLHKNVDNSNGIFKMEI